MDDLKEKFKDEKFDIIVLAGQSNAEGNGKGDACDYIPDMRILMMNDDSMPHFEKTGDKSRLVLNYPARDYVLRKSRRIKAEKGEIFLCRSRGITRKRFWGPTEKY